MFLAGARVAQLWISRGYGARNFRLTEGTQASMGGELYLKEGCMKEFRQNSMANR